MKNVKNAIICFIKFCEREFDSASFHEGLIPLSISTDSKNIIIIMREACKETTPCTFASRTKPLIHTLQQYFWLWIYGELSTLLPRISN